MMKKTFTLFLLLFFALSMAAADGFRQDSIYERVYQNLYATGDIEATGDGSTSFVRQLFNFEELTSDEAYCT